MKPENDDAARQNQEWELDALYRDSQDESALMDRLQNDAARALKGLTIQYFPAFSQWDGELIRAANEAISRATTDIAHKLTSLSFRHGKAHEG